MDSLLWPIFAQAYFDWLHECAEHRRYLLRIGAPGPVGQVGGMLVSAGQRLQAWDKVIRRAQANPVPLAQVMRLVLARLEEQVQQAQASR